MPHVLVKHTALPALHPEFKARVRRGVRLTGAQQLSVTERQLSSHDFSFGWLECDEEDLNHDVELVFTGVHNYQERADRHKKITEKIQVGVAEELRHFRPNGRPLTLSTTITLAPTKHIGGAVAEPAKS